MTSGATCRATTPTRTVALALAAAWLAPCAAFAQGFDSGSDGSDGALTFPPNAGTIQFDPRSYDPPLDPDDDGVYHFTTISVGVNTTVRLSTRHFLQGRPVIWLASGAVVIDGTLDLGGEAGHPYNGVVAASVAGAGGWSGGTGGRADGVAAAGNGPGGGKVAVELHGGAAGHTVAGGVSSSGAGGPGYGNDFLLPLLGGSGGAGGGRAGASGGGAGGGALLIASSVSIRLSGTIRANGGDGGHVFNTLKGGGGSGGAVRLLAPELDGGGTIDVVGGVGWAVRASHGRVRLEAFRFRATYNVNPGNALMPLASPGAVMPPPSAPDIRVVRVAGQTVEVDPQGRFETPDVVIDAPAPVLVELEARNIPLGTVLQLSFQPETGASVDVTSTPLTGTLELSTASATVQFPHGATRVFVRASWSP